MSKESGTEDVDWWLTGSAALAIRHVAVVPRDIDLVVETGEDAEKLGEALSNWLVEHVLRSEGWVARWFGRSFKAARIERVGEVEAWVDLPEPSDFGPVARRNLRWPVGVESRYGFHSSSYS